MKQAIGVYTISNNLSVQVFDVEHGIEDQVLAGIDYDNAEWCEIQYKTGEEGDDETYFKLGEIEIPFNEVIRL